jgi:hypothetical protein
MEIFDLEQTRKLASLMAVPQEQHDDHWCADFFRAVPNASLASFDPQIQNGPDTFPYFQLALPDPGPFTPFSIVHLLNYVLQNGAGVVVHANTKRDRPPLWVFSFGDILSYSMLGEATPRSLPIPILRRIRMPGKFFKRLPMNRIFRRAPVRRLADSCVGRSGIRVPKSVW